MLTPSPRGAVSGAVLGALRTGEAVPDVGAAEASSDDDLHLALWVLFELSYRGFEDVDERREWDPDLLRVRRSLEDAFEAELRARCSPEPDGADVATAIFALCEADDGPSLATHVHRHATREQVEQLLAIRSVYHLKEQDPTAWVVPRLGAAPKAALLELQFDEYGNGDPNRLHHHLFAQGMEAAGLDPKYGAYVDDAPAEALAQNNAMSMFGLQRRLRGAALGHLAAFEATSSLPSRRMAQGLERLGFAPEMIAYYTEHVEADAVHEQLAARVICGSLLEDDPHLREDVLLGARVCLDLENRLAERLLGEWAA